MGVGSCRLFVCSLGVHVEKNRDWLPLCVHIEYKFNAIESNRSCVGACMDIRSAVECVCYSSMWATVTTRKARLGRLHDTVSKRNQDSYTGILLFFYHHHSLFLLLYRFIYTVCIDASPYCCCCCWETMEFCRLNATVGLWLELPLDVIVIPSSSHGWWLDTINVPSSSSSWLFVRFILLFEGVYFFASRAAVLLLFAYTL